MQTWKCMVFLDVVGKHLTKIFVDSLSTKSQSKEGEMDAKMGMDGFHVGGTKACSLLLTALCNRIHTR